MTKTLARVIVPRVALGSAILLMAAGSLAAQRPLTRADSALAGRILLAEDQRDSSSGVFAEAARHADARIRLLASRARARIRDPKFAARDSLPRPVAPPTYPDPAWRLRFRGLANDKR